MQQEAFRVIPGFDDFCVTRDGRIFNALTGKLIRAHVYGDRKFVSYPTDVTTKLLSVHRAVALAWVENDDPVRKTVVNHLDGNPLNNHFSNLEWTTSSGNNYHAVNAGLREDNKPCKIRDFYTHEVREFPSIRQACGFMKINEYTAIEKLKPAKFGSLIFGRYEFRLLDDPEPFFYENRDYIISPSRYMVEVSEEDGRKRYYFKNTDFMQAYQLYRSPYGRSVPGLLNFAREMYPNKTFTLRDGYEESRNEGSKQRALRTTVKMFPVVARKGGEKLEFKSISAAAGYFGVDRSLIKLRLSDSESTFLGWSFEGKPISLPYRAGQSEPLETHEVPKSIEDHVSNTDSPS